MAYNPKTNLYEGYIYCIENKVNHKRYVGQTTCAIENRFIQHKSCARTGSDTYLYRAIRKYGEDNFFIYEVSKHTSDSMNGLQNLLNEFESFSIDNIGTIAPHGYNMTSGGMVFAHMFQQSVAVVSSSGDVLNIYPSIRMAALANDTDEKSAAHACRSVTHFSNGLFWYYNNGEFRVGDNIGLQQRGKNNWKGHITYKGKPVMMVDKNGNEIKRFDSASDAGRQLNLDQSRISDCCYGKRKTTGGYCWKFLNK